MDLAKYCVNAVLVERRSYREVGVALGRSKSWVANQVHRYQQGGEEALRPKKRGPKVAKNRTVPALEDKIVTLRKHLVEEGLDAGATTIAYYLDRQGLTPPARSTVHRVLVRRGFVTPQPKKRPRNSYIRFESDLPNETWQSDMTHWHLKDNQRVEIVNFIDDYSRAILGSTVVPVTTAPTVVDLFFRACESYGFPLSVLSDNGAIYTAAYRGSHSGLEIELAKLGIVFKHGRPYHPQTQGKVERFHLTLKKWLKKQPLSETIPELQARLDRFIFHYNEERLHTARGCPPMQAWRERDKAVLEVSGLALRPHTRVRRDKIDKTGVVTLRYRSRLHHVGVGRRHHGKHVLILIADLDIRVIDVDGEMLAHLTLDPTRDYQPIRKT